MSPTLSCLVIATEAGPVQAGLMEVVQVTDWYVLSQCVTDTAQLSNNAMPAFPAGVLTKCKHLCNCPRVRNQASQHLAAFSTLLLPSGDLVSKIHSSVACGYDCIYTL